MTGPRRVYTFLGPLSPDPITLEFQDHPTVVEVAVQLGIRFFCPAESVCLWYHESKMDLRDRLLIDHKDIVWPYTVTCRWKREITVSKDSERYELEVPGLATVREVRKEVARKFYSDQFGLVVLRDQRNGILGEWRLCPDEVISDLYETKQEITLNFTGLTPLSSPWHAKGPRKAVDTVFDLQSDEAAKNDQQNDAHETEEPSPYRFLITDRDKVILDGREQLARLDGSNVYHHTVGKWIKVTRPVREEFFYFPTGMPPTREQMCESLRAKGMDYLFAFLYRGREVPNYLNLLHLNLIVPIAEFQAEIERTINVWYTLDGSQKYVKVSVNSRTPVKDVRKEMEVRLCRRISAVRTSSGQELTDDDVIPNNKIMVTNDEYREKVHQFKFKFQNNTKEESYKISDTLRAAFEHFSQMLGSAVSIFLDDGFPVSEQSQFWQFPPNTVFIVKRQKFVTIVSPTWRIEKFPIPEGSKDLDVVVKANGLASYLFYTRFQQITDTIPDGQTRIYAIHKDTKFNVRLLSSSGSIDGEYFGHLPISCLPKSQGEGLVRVDDQEVDNRTLICAIMLDNPNYVFSRKKRLKVAVTEANPDPQPAALSPPKQGPESARTTVTVHTPISEQETGDIHMNVKEWSTAGGLTEEFKSSGHCPEFYQKSKSVVLKPYGQATDNMEPLDENERMVEWVQKNPNMKLVPAVMLEFVAPSVSKRLAIYLGAKVGSIKAKLPRLLTGIGQVFELSVLGVCLESDWSIRTTPLDSDWKVTVHTSKVDTKEWRYNGVSNRIYRVLASGNEFDYEKFANLRSQAANDKKQPPATRRPMSSPVQQPKKPEAQPEAKKPEAQPEAKKPEAQPEAKEPEAQPEAKKPEAQPESEKPEAQPESKKPEAQPESEKPEAQPESEKPEAQPEAKKPEAQPEAKKPEAQPEAKKPEAQPESEKPEGQPEAKKPEAQPESEKPEGQPEAKKPEAQPESKKPEAQPEAKKPEAQPESEKPEGQPEAKHAYTFEYDDKQFQLLVDDSDSVADVCEKLVAENKVKPPAWSLTICLAGRVLEPSIVLSRMRIPKEMVLLVMAEDIETVFVRTALALRLS